MIQVVNKHFPIEIEQHSAVVYVGRPSKWGNPFVIGKDGTREEVIEKYREWIATRPELIDALAERKPAVLVCWCAPNACHADVLKELLEARKETR